jgi:hypothetical protein
MDGNSGTADNAGREAPEIAAVEIPSVDPVVEKARQVEAFQAGLSRETRSTGVWMLL